MTASLPLFEELQPIELFLPEIRVLLDRRDFTTLKSLLAEINPVDMADGLPRFSADQRLLLFRLLKPEAMVKVFGELDVSVQEEILQRLDDGALTPLLEDIPADVAAGLFRRLSPRVVRKMSTLMRLERVEVVRDILEYSPGTVGSLMRTDVTTLSPDVNSRTALDRFQARARMRRTVVPDTLYVCDVDGRLLGALPLRVLITAPPDILIREIMSPVSPIKISAHADQEDAAQRMSRYKLSVAPVVDDRNRLVGVLTIDDLIEIIKKEDTEDIQKFGGMEALEDPYFDIGFWRMVKKRAGWLLVLFLGEMLTATAMAFFEKEIARAVVLALFIPLIISSGGNSGSQAATLIVRALALGEVTLRDWWRVARREFMAGLALGLVLGSVGFLRIFLWSMFSDIYGPHALLVGLTVGVSLVLIVLWGSLAGSLLPIVLRRFGLDPAVVSAPFVATMVDVTGLIVYFSVGYVVLSGALL